MPLAIGIEDELRDAFAIAQVDEDAPAVVAVAGAPTEEHDLLAFVGGTEAAAVVRSFELVDEPGHGNLAKIESGNGAAEASRTHGRAPIAGAAGTP